MASGSAAMAIGVLALGLGSVAAGGAVSSPVGEPATASAAAMRGTPVRVSHPAFPGPHHAHVGISAAGRPIAAVNRVGSPGADRTVVAVGVIHGSERHGRLVTDRLLSAPLPADLDLWVVPTVNPDGEARGTRKNARGVDLNRNWPANWETGGFFSSGRYHPGSGPASEPETQAMMAFLRSIEPDVTIWFHSPWDRVDCDVKRVGRACVDYAAAVGSPLSFAPRPGTATDWIMTEGLGVSFVHEFAVTVPSAATVDRHVAAVLHLAS